MLHIPFNKPFIAGKELHYIAQAVEFGNISGDGHFTKRCAGFLEDAYSVPRVLMTPSCTAALELAAATCGLKPGDEVILPSFTFVSTANAIVRQGATPIFVDIRPDTLNIDEELIESKITDRTRAIIPVHYAGVGCEMDRIMSIARDHDLIVIEDAAQGVNASYKNRALGSIGHLGTYSFHETKNYICGEGGALCINNTKYCERAEIIRDKGTNRQQFLRGETAKYTWVEIGSSHVPSEISCAFLTAQLEKLSVISNRRSDLYRNYHDRLSFLQEEERLQLPIIPAECGSNHHTFYILLPDKSTRDGLMHYLNQNGVSAVFHYIPLHSSPMGETFGYQASDLPVTQSISGRLLRLPLYYELTEDEQDVVVKLCAEYLQGRVQKRGRTKKAATGATGKPRAATAKRPSLLVLGAGHNQVPLLKTAQFHDVRVVAIDPDPNAHGFDFADDFVVADLGDAETCVDAARHFRVDGVITAAADYPVPTVARVCRQLGFAGIDETTARRCTDKYEMRSALAQANVACPPFFKAESFAQAVAAFELLERPAIFKPALSSGGQGITHVDIDANQTQLRAAFGWAMRHSRNEAILVEEFADGPEFSVEALTWDDKTHIVGITDKVTTGSPHFVEIGHSQPTQLDDSDQESLILLAKEAIRALGIDWSASHIEIRLTDEGPKIVEVGARLGGGCITSHLVPLSTGIDMTAAAISVALCERPKLMASHKRGAAVSFLVPPEGVVRSIHGVAESRGLLGVHEVLVDVKPGDVVRELTDSKGRAGHVITEAASAEAAIQIANHVRTMVQFETEMNDAQGRIVPT